jgi:hypothetical protein
MFKNYFGPRVFLFQETNNGFRSSTEEVISSLDRLKNEVKSSQSTETLFPAAQFDMLASRIANLDENDPNWLAICQRVLNLIALHDGDNKTDSWDDYGLDKKEDIVNLSNLLREQIYGPATSNNKLKSGAKVEYYETWPPRWVRELFSKLNEFEPQAREIILRLLVNLGYVTTQKSANILSKDRIQTQSFNNGSQANINQITLNDGTICYLTNDHVVVDNNKKLRQWHTSKVRYDLKLLQLEDGSSKIDCKQELLKTARFNTIQDSQNYLQQNPQLTLSTNQSLLHPADKDRKHNYHTYIEPGINTSSIPAKYLFGTRYNFFYTIENGDQTVPGSSGGSIYDHKGELVALHNEADYYYGNLSLYKDILNPNLVSLEDILKVAKIPDADWQVKDQAQSVLIEKFRNNLASQGLYLSNQAGIYNTRLLNQMVKIISKELSTTGTSQTYNLLVQGDLKKIINHGIDLSLQRDFEEASNNVVKLNYLKTKQDLIQQNRANILEVVMQGKQIATAIPITKQTLNVLEVSEN